MGLTQIALNNWILSVADRGAPPKSWECCQMPLAESASAAEPTSLGSTSFWSSTRSVV